jgi:hypothetical protein
LTCIKSKVPASGEISRSGYKRSRRRLDASGDGDRTK